FSFNYSPASRHLLSFPTRRSSDLDVTRTRQGDIDDQFFQRPPMRSDSGRLTSGQVATEDRVLAIRARCPRCRQQKIDMRPRRDRSEEHTSELQSLRHLVCRLLLEK